MCMYVYIHRMYLCVHHSNPVYVCVCFFKHFLEMSSKKAHVPPTRLCSPHYHFTDAVATLVGLCGVGTRGTMI